MDMTWPGFGNLGLSSMKRLERVDRFCPNPDCPHRRKFGEAKYIGSGQHGAYGRWHCRSCMQWWAWDGEVLVEVGTMVLEDKLMEGVAT